MTKEEYLDFCGSIAGATYDQPFNEDFQSTAPLGHEKVVRAFDVPQ